MIKPGWFVYFKCVKSVRAVKPQPVHDISSDCVYMDFVYMNIWRQFDKEN